MSARRFRDVLLVVLALTAGATDATAFVRLGHVFASVITGNLVLLGISAVRADGSLALFSGCALCSYALGVLIAAPRHPAADAEGPLWPTSATLALVFEIGLLIGFAVIWQIDGQAPSRAMQIVMLALSGAAMGVQSTAVRRLGQMSTTYLTSTLTGLVEALVVRRFTADHVRSLAILLSAVAGAAGAIGLVEHYFRWLSALELLPLVIVALGSLRLTGVREA